MIVVEKGWSDGRYVVQRRKACVIAEAVIRGYEETRGAWINGTIFMPYEQFLELRDRKVSEEIMDAEVKKLEGEVKVEEAKPVDTYAEIAASTPAPATAKCAGCGGMFFVPVALHHSDNECLRGQLKKARQGCMRLAADRREADSVARAASEREREAIIALDNARGELRALRGPIDEASARIMAEAEVAAFMLRGDGPQSKTPAGQKLRAAFKALQDRIDLYEPVFAELRKERDEARCETTRVRMDLELKLSEVYGAIAEWRDAAILKDRKMRVLIDMQYAYTHEQAKKAEAAVVLEKMIDEETTNHGG